MDKFALKKNKFLDKTYAQKGFYSFLYRYCDSGFRTKWCGFWVPSKKILDYYVYNIDGVWLDSKNQTDFVLEKEKVTHKYSLKQQGLSVSETAFVPLDMKSMISVLNVKNNTDTNKKIKISLEMAINIRTKDENWHNRTYTTHYNVLRKSVDISSNEIVGFIRMGIAKSEGITFKFSEDGSYKDHYPSEKQRCFIPGKMEAFVTIPPGKTQKIPFIVSASDISMDDVSENYDYSINNWENMIVQKKELFTKLFTTERIETENKKIDAAFSWSAVNLANLVQNTENGTSLFAGLPWFLRFWSRDTLWSVLALIDVGEFYAAKHCLLGIAKNYNKKIPTVTNFDGTNEYYSDDVDPLFIIASDYYVKNSGDFEFEKNVKPIIKEIVSNLKLDKNNLVVTKPNGSWMDSYERKGTQIDIQSLWISALQTVNVKKSKLLEKAMDTYLWNISENYPKDTSKDDSMTINCTVPIMFGHFPKSRSVISLARIDEEFATKFGVRTRSPYSDGYGSSVYHKGASWGLTTGWTAAAAFSQGLTDYGAKYLEMMASELDKNQISAMAECVDSETGNICGATMQTWSHAMYIHAIDRYMFGIDTDLKKNILTLKPNIPTSWKSVARFGKKMGYYSMNLRVDSDTKKIEMRVHFTSDTKLKGVIDLPYEIKRLVVNGKKVNGNTAEFVFKKENKIVGYY